MEASNETVSGAVSDQGMGRVFVRKASGLVRDFSQVDAWMYNVLAINPVVLLALAYVSIAAIFPQANLPLAILFCGLLCLAQAVTYSFFTAIMPRSGGDYVFQSRVLGGGIATATVFTGIVLAQFVIFGVIAFLVTTSVISPFFILLGTEYGWTWLVDVGNWTATQTGTFLTSLAWVSFAVALNLFGLRIYALVQRYLFTIGLVGLAIALIMLLFTSQTDFIGNLNGFMAENYDVENAYASMIEAGGVPDTSFSLWETMQAAVFASLFLVFSHWSVQQGGEIKRQGSFESNLRQIPGALIFSTAAIILIAVLLVDKVGIDFLHASGTLYLDGSPDYVLPVEPFFGFFVALASGSPFFLWVAFLMFISWAVMICPNIPLACSRMMMAMSIDRILPAWFGKVHPRLHVPVNSILTIAVGGIAFLAAYVYIEDFVELTFALILPTLTAFAFTMVAALLFPRRSPHLFEGTAADRIRVGGVPLMQITAVIFLAFVLFIDYQIFFNDKLGLNGTKALLFDAALYAIAIGTYVAAKLYRKRREKFDLSVAYKELPVE